jgi:flagellar export protein FliJ
MPYQSRLAGVLFQRKYNEEEAERAFLTAKNILLSEQEKLRLLQNKFHATLDDLTTIEERGGASDEIALYFRYIEWLQGVVDKQRTAIVRQEAICEVKRVQLTTAVQERKAVETIEEKRKTDYRNAAAKKEQIVLDEIGGQLKMRNHA